MIRIIFNITYFINISNILFYLLFIITCHNMKITEHLLNFFLLYLSIKKNHHLLSLLIYEYVQKIMRRENNLTDIKVYTRKKLSKTKKQKGVKDK